MEEHEKGREAFESEEAFRLHALRHSTAHVMAEAIQSIFPEAKFTIGPPIKDGFFYDVDVSRPITTDDLTAIEKQMKAICKRNSSFERRVLDRPEAVALFEKLGQPYKVDRIRALPDDAEISIYDQGGFTDLCAGPHVPRTRNCRHFKLLKVSGAYLHGDSKNKQLQRVYGTVWGTREELDTYLYRLEEARKRDHRRLGTQLGLFMFHDYAPGAPFWLPRGEDLYHTLSEFMRTRLLGEGYVSVRTPMVFDKELWETSGHWEHYQENMFHFAEGRFAEGDADEEDDSKILGLKPMNCPSHMLIFGSARRSYRELPLRIHDQGVLHRNEIRGALGGLTRVRQFSQDDAHIFCAEDQIRGEIERLLSLIQDLYAAFGMRFNAKLSTRPEKKLGSDALWDAAEGALQGALDTVGMPYVVNAGDGAFYGPKIDFDVLDALEREWQCATIQLDFQLPRRFQLTFIGADNAEHTPVVIHRAIFGSFERFIGILIEHYAGAFPVWLAPEQVRVMTVSQKSLAHGRVVTDALQAGGVKVVFDDGDEKIGKKIAVCRNDRVPYMAIIGEKELEAGTVSVRSRDEGELGSLALADFVARVVAEGRPPLPGAQQSA
ncbi:MAG: threonine--tRNA ligase [Alphaproteobacteria bacterium]|nr:threonine--tRNA ligase [Alphaproteobacteria bacterium]